jgi:hypothetical protein
MTPSWPNGRKTDQFLGDSRRQSQLQHRSRNGAPPHVNGKLAAEGETKKAMFRDSLEPFEMGRDSISPVNADYNAKVPYEFTGKIEKISFELTPR